MKTTQAPPNTHVFLDLLRRSGLLEKQDLDAYVAALRDTEAMSAADLAAKMQSDNLLTAFQANHLLKGRYKNFTIGKYRVLEPLGAGGMSQVFLCEHAVMKHRVALKLLPIKDSSDPEAVSRFVREARAAAAVNHPNVVRAHDVDKAEGKFHYIVMDYVDGVNLHDLVRRVGPLPPEQAAHYIAQAAVGVQEIAGKGLIHRDLKPSNLLLDRDGVIRILDLGLARFTDQGKDDVTRQFNSESVFGTADYLAPEQALRQDSVDARADIYSLGATLYFLLAGSAPFESASVAQKLLAHQMRDPDAIDGVPKEMMAVLLKMMAKQPDDRYQESIEVTGREALDRWTRLRLPLPDPAWFPRSATNSGPTSSGPRTGVRGGAAPSTRGLGKTASSPRLSSRYAPDLSLDSMDLAPPSKVKLYAGIGVALTAALVGVLFAAGVFSKKTDDKTPPVVQINTPTSVPNPIPNGVDSLIDPATPPPAGSLVVGPNGAFKSVAEAMAAAKPGSRIVITSAQHTESLTVVKVPAGVTLQGWPESRPVKWQPIGDSPALRIESAIGLTVSHFEFDGSGRAPVLVEVAGNCPGTVLTNITASHFTRHAVGVSAGSDDPAKPLALRKLRLLGTAGTAGVRFTGASSHVVLESNRFEGAFESAIDFGSGTENVTVLHNRFHRAKAAISLPDTPAAGGVQVLGNTFAECGSGLAFDKLPAAPERVVFKNNLLMKCGTVFSYAALAGGKLDAPATWVWHDEGLDDDKRTNTPEGTRYFRKTLDLPAKLPDAVLDVGAVTAFKVFVNGALVGESVPKHFTKRVHAFNVAPLLKEGRNVVAIEVTHTKDPINPAYAVAAGVVARLAQPGKENAPVFVIDSSWKSSEVAASDWAKESFNDEGWRSVLPWSKAGYVFPWQGSVWDSVSKQRLRIANPAGVLIAEGNVRDYDTGEGFPLSSAVRGVLDKERYKVLFDPADDAVFLRTPKAPAKLLTAGTDGGPVGVPAGK